MEETILYALYLKQLQLAFIAICILTASILSIYNLPWRELEFAEVVSSVTDLFRKGTAEKMSQVQSSNHDVGQKMT